MFHWQMDEQTSLFYDLDEKFLLIVSILLLETTCPLVRLSAQKYRIYRALYLGNQKSYERSAGV